MDLKAYVEEKARAAKEAARHLAVLSAAVKDRALAAMADALEAEHATILEANARDLEQARRDGLSKALIDRLTLNPKRIGEIARSVREVIALPDPVGEVLRMWRRPNGMQVGRVRVPIGVIAIIYESRPNVTVESAVLCLKSGNAVVLRGGSEAVHSNAALVGLMSAAAEKQGVPRGAITFLERTEREAVYALLKMDSYVDLVIPRGGESLMRTVAEHATIPVIKHDKGVCHIFVDDMADLSMAEEVCYNAKVQRPGTCNAMETLLVHEAVAGRFLPGMFRRLRAAGVELRGCPRTRALDPAVVPASDQDWGTEYLDLILAVRVVRDLDEAIAHIDRYGSRHTDAILTRDHGRAMRFLREVDSSAVMVNASTRLNDGFQFGLGAEIGISTTRIHARGPMGLEELTSTKFIVLGDGQLRE